ncbi:hypothetical protein CMO96_04695 [Candidatus Woesebacteria bacterium]|nr:hypothetical protein [Candidatus Woesebacteria bacterium]
MAAEDAQQPAQNPPPAGGSPPPAQPTAPQPEAGETTEHLVQNTEEPPPPGLLKQPNLKKWLIIGAAVILAAFLVVTGIQAYLSSQSQKQVEAPSTMEEPPAPPAPPALPTSPDTEAGASGVPNGTAETANWKTYTNKLWDYSIKYPSDQLVACSPTDEEGLILWVSPFVCPVGGHDILYEIAVTGRKEGEYKQYKNPVSTKEVIVGGVNSTQNDYKYDNMDGPLEAFGGSTEILVPVDGGIIQITLLGNTTEKKNRFDQILSTFEFTQ